LTGHQHFQHSFVKENLSDAGERVVYLEGGALQDEDFPSKSSFNVIEMDFPERKQRIFTFEWKKDHYSLVVHKDWLPLIENKAGRHEFRLSDDFKRLPR
jgi:hypothetical protein